MMRKINHMNFLISFAAVAASSPLWADQAPSTFMSQSLGVFVFPSKGQTATQQQNDEASCFNWAKSTSGFDPLAPPPLPALNPPQQAAQQPPPNPAANAPVRGAAGGAAAGAAIGAVAGNAGKGAAIGATAGALSGIAARSQGAQVAQQQQARQTAAVELEAERQLAALRASYNRAFSACLEGKGYTVR
jgi:YMGG-like Gly-zipper